MCPSIFVNATLFLTYIVLCMLLLQGEGLCHSTRDGPYPNTGCDMKDYIITVGKVNATVNEVLTNSVRFSPPSAKPDHDFGRDGNPDVKVGLWMILY